MMAWVKMDYKTDFSKSNLAWKSLKFCIGIVAIRNSLRKLLSFIYVKFFKLLFHKFRKQIHRDTGYCSFNESSFFFFFLNASSPATKFRRINTYPDMSVSIPPSVNNCPDSLEVSTILNEEYKI